MIKGLIAPILSPFNDDLSFNQELYNELATELLSTGCSGLAPFGTTGEALSVSSAERMAAIEGLIKSGVDPKCVIPGTGLCNLPESIALSRHAVELGCAGVMTLPPFYFKGMGDDGYFDYFEKLIDGVDHPDLKIYLYHIPQVSGVGLSIDLVKRLRAAYPDVIVGIKDSSGDWDNTRRLLAIEDRLEREAAARDQILARVAPVDVLRRAKVEVLGALPRLVADRVEAAQGNRAVAMRGAHMWGRPSLAVSVCNGRSKISQEAMVTL